MKNNIISYSEILNSLFQKVVVSNATQEESKVYDKLCQWFNNEVEQELIEKERICNL
jgi:ribosome biogenesis SPOUT family RNA methylase Rps3